MIEIKVITDKTEFFEFKDKWNRLLDKSPNPHIHFTFEWMKYWIEVFGNQVQLYILTAYESGELIGIAPLCIIKKGKLPANTLKFRQLVFMGYGFQDAADFIITKEKDAVLNAFIMKAINDEDIWDETELRQISNHSVNYNVLYEIIKGFEGKYNTDNNFLIGCPYLEIEGSFDSYYSSLGTSWTKKNEKYIRQLNALGLLEFKVEEKISDILLKEILELNIKRNKTTGRRSIFLEKKKSEFINLMLPEFSEMNRLRIFCLRHNGKLVTYSISFFYNNKIYRWNTSFNLDYQKYSVGRVLTKYIIEYCFKNKITESDWMAGVEEHKLHWTQTLRENRILRIRKKNLKSDFAGLYSEFRDLLKEKFNA